MSARSMSKARAKPQVELRAEYRREDLGAGVRGKYLKQVQSGTNLVLLAPDVARVFKTDDAVNEVLRSLIGVAERSVRNATRKKKPNPKLAISAKN